MKSNKMVRFIVKLVFFIVLLVPFSVIAEQNSTYSPEASMIGVKLFTNTALTAIHSQTSDGRDKLILDYSGAGTLNLGLLQNTYVIFEIPSEIGDRITIENIDASYDVPLIGLPEIEIGRNQGHFNQTDISIDGRSVILNFRELIGVSLLSSNSYYFSLEITLDEMPFSIEPAYQFCTEATDAILNLSVIGGNIACTTLPAPQFEVPEAPIVHPVYSNDTVVTGTAEANTTIKMAIDGNEYTGSVSDDGSFSVKIPPQEAGTVIVATQTDENGMISDASEVIVIQASLQFHYIPEILPFKTTALVSTFVSIRRQDPNWTIEVLDTRGEGSNWRLTAEANQPLTSVTNPSHTLPHALVYVDAQKISYSLTEGPVEVFFGKTGMERINSVNWVEEAGPMIEMIPSEAYAGKYSTTITWTLIDAP